ncbi:Pycsar system effector family protein [Flavobacterium sp. JP2137]|uniref:Pycsar system effector family protein n=1 Tax=Flavobacterium sp. JP2137 TaxID=3414510 RepID=UPI003D2FEAE0
MTVLQKTEEYIANLYKDTLSQQHTYHNYSHTVRVVTAVRELIAAEGISETEAEYLQIAAWFHDIGYGQNCEKHEAESAKIAAEFLQRQNYAPEKIAIVCELIMATQYLVEPKTPLEGLIKDADFVHFGDANYGQICCLLRTELRDCNNRDFSDLEWAMANRDMMQNKHRYYSAHALKHWQPIKEQNLLKIHQQIENLNQLQQQEDKALKKQKKAEKADRPDRGIDTLFRVTLNNHTRLSDIADSKANILLSVNAIIISICLSTLVPKLDSAKNAHLIYPTFVLLISSVATIICAILSTKPKVTSGTFTRADIEKQKVNLLFFGNFHKMPLEEYTWAINEVMKDRSYLYNSLIQDLYYLGLVLNRKYRLLRITYNVFMVGILASVISFIWAFMGAGF